MYFCFIVSLQVTLFTCLFSCVIFTEFVIPQKEKKNVLVNISLLQQFARDEGIRIAS